MNQINETDLLIEQINQQIVQQPVETKPHRDRIPITPPAGGISPEELKTKYHGSMEELKRARDNQPAAAGKVLNLDVKPASEESKIGFNVPDEVVNKFKEEAEKKKIEKEKAENKGSDELNSQKKPNTKANDDLKKEPLKESEPIEEDAKYSIPPKVDVPKEKANSITIKLSDKANLTIRLGREHFISIEDGREIEKNKKFLPISIDKFQKTWYGEVKSTERLKDMIKRRYTKDLLKEDYEPEIIENIEEKINEITGKLLGEFPIIDDVVEKGKSKGKDDEKEFIKRLIQDYISQLELFHNQSNEPFARVPIDSEHYVIVSTNSKDLKEWFTGKIHKDLNEIISKYELESVATLLSYKAKAEGEMHTLYNRACMIDNVLWYDLGNNEAVKITSGKREIIKDVPILFRKYSHQQAHKDVQLRGDIKAIIPFLNIKNKCEKLLALIVLVAYYIPDIPRPIIVFHGEQGSAKSTMQKRFKTLVDPSAMELINMPTDDNQLIQQLSHHYLAPFDNISRISKSQSDIFCRAISGDGNSKRALYSDEDDVILTYQRCVMFNGINQIVSQPDLLNRSILIETEKITESIRKTEKEIDAEFNAVKPTILGGIFEVLSKAIEIYPSIKLTTKPRMADFCVWGCAIAEAMGYTQEEFLTAYNKNISEQNAEALEASEIGFFISKLMNNKYYWSGTSQQLLDEMINISINDDISKGEYFPRNARALSQHINKIISNFRNIGIDIIHLRRTNERLISITNNNFNKPTSTSIDGKRVISTIADGCAYMKTVIELELGIKNRPVPYSLEEANIKKIINDRVNIYDEKTPNLFELCYEYMWPRIKI